MPNEKRQRLLVLGSRGQVGWELVRTLAPLGDVVALDRAALDLTQSDATRSTVRSVAADVIVNAAAYTHVDQAEEEPQLAMRVNADAPAILAEEARRNDVLLVHFSTDYVFRGDASTPYREEDEPSPMTAYGRSKLAGDNAILQSDAFAYVFRVGWVYGSRGRNFLQTIRRLTRERDVLRVVNDQYGSPTWSRAIAEAVSLTIGAWLDARRRQLQTPPPGLYHMAAPDHTTWHAFASAIVEALPAPKGRPRPRVTPIATTEYPTLAARPERSVLDSRRLRETFGLSLPAWRDQLAMCLDEMVTPTSESGATSV